MTSNPEILTQNKMTVEIFTEILIEAQPKKVWEILTDFENYPEWNSFVKSIEGNIKVGNIISVRIEPPNGNGLTFKPVVVAYDPPKELRWLGKFFIKGVFDGEHQFKLIDNKNGTTTFIQSETFTGILVGVFKNNLNNTKTGFEQMNLELKELAER